MESGVIQMQQWGVSKMVYTVLFFGMDTGCYKFPFQNLSKQDEQTVDAKLDRNDGKEIKCNLFIFICSVPIFL